MYSKDELIEEVNKLSWLHTIDLGNGVVTPGKWTPSPLITQAFDKVNFKGKKVLDVGACDGLWSFEAEKRGASKVYSIDYIQFIDFAYKTTYQLAHEALGSNAHYYPDVSVYDVERLNINDFDVIIFCGVYYHLKNPLLALAKLRKVLKTGGRIIIEGPIINDSEQVFARFYYHKLYSDHISNWWVPSRACLPEWVECSFFDIVEKFEKPDPAYMNGLAFKLKTIVKRTLGRDTTFTKRLVILAEGVRRKDALYPFPDEDLAEFHIHD